MVAPKFTLLTPLFHPIVAEIMNPEVHTFCENCFPWSPAKTIESALLRFYEELRRYDIVDLACCEPSPVVDLLIAGKKEQFEQTARLYT